MPTPLASARPMKDHLRPHALKTKYVARALVLETPIEKPTHVARAHPLETRVVKNEREAHANKRAPHVLMSELETHTFRCTARSPDS